MNSRATNFTISENGSLYTIGSIDKEKLYQDDPISFFVLATDRGSPPMNNTVEVTVMVTDVNDHAPVFVSDSQTFEFPELYNGSEFYIAKVSKKERMLFKHDRWYDVLIQY